ncbi:MAG: N-acetylmuramoyl-L-alanine amidase [Acidobacteriota bacterium]
MIHAKRIGSLLLLLLLVQACSSAPVQPPVYSGKGSPYPSPYRSGPKVVEKNAADYGKPRTITHEVGPLETVWRISRMYDVPVEDICRANCIKPDDPIHIGQKLTIPNARGMRHVVTLYPNSRWKFIIVHHTATDVGNALLINRAHGDRGFWNGLGYHFLIDNGTMGKGDGQIEVSPRWIRQQVGAHCKAGGMNEKGIGISLVGNFNEELPTRAQLESLDYLLKRLCAYYNIPFQSVMGHRDVEGAATDCPGRRFPWSSVRQCLSSR